MVETLERTRSKGISFRQRLCQGLGLNPRNPHTRILSLLQKTGDVVAVAIALEDSLKNNKPFNGSRPLSNKLVEERLTSFALKVVRRSEGNLLVPLEEMEDMMLQVVLRLRAALGCSNTRAERDRVSWEYWQRLQTVTTGR